MVKDKNWIKRWMCIKYDNRGMWYLWRYEIWDSLSKEQLVYKHQIVNLIKAHWYIILEKTII